MTRKAHDLCPWLCATCVLAAASIPGTRATPAYFATVANQVLRMKGGPRLAEGGELNIQAVKELETQVKRVMAADPGIELNVSALRDRPEPELLRILLLAVLGNFSSASAADWNRPCSLVIDPETGQVALQTPAPVASLALKVVLVLLVAVQIRQWVREIQARGGGKEQDIEPPRTQHHRKGL